VIHGTTPTSTRAFGEGASLDAVTEEIIAATGGDVLRVFGDLTDPATVNRLLDEVNARYGRVDILVNNAGGDIGAAGTGGPGRRQADPERRRRDLAGGRPGRPRP
jgi:3-oxoacyl-[acyl-carrier protein] reductase